MKKILSVILSAMMILSICTMFTISSSAAIDAFDATTLGKPEDFTEQVKWATVYQVYKNKLPIVRADAIFLSGADFDYCTAPGTGTRTVTFTDWKEQGMTPFFNDDFCLDEGTFYYYGCVWANKTDCGEWDDRGRFSCKFTVEEAGTYEIVVLGCAQIKADVADNPAKERGFAYDIDGKGLAQVNTSKTYGSFGGDYLYTYSEADLKAGYETYAATKESGYYEPTYYYGITFDLTAGEHTLDIYTLFYTSDGAKVTGNGPRLNFIAAYVEKAISDAEFENYKYPETEAETTAEATTAAATTAAPVTTKAPDNTTAPETKAAEVTTKTETTEPAIKSGCGGTMGLAAIVALVPAALCIKRKKH